MSDEKLYDLEQLNAIAAGNEDFVIKMVNMFLKMTPELVGRIEAGLQTQNWAEVQSAAHKMKPSVDMMGVKSLHDVIRAIEGNAKTESNLEQIPELYFKLSETLENVYEQLRNR
ncbi:MAG: HPt (histidine-containing phosphotransfer) domain-containing protein [Bacteroidia bacterium]|jgi:HPt (histidine-containing phosphotransfer) domain-containing protein|tara:strand:- start:2678 stop:3019 length:342 start_codon:yes stop_codon:yes gene_type:complete